MDGRLIWLRTSFRAYVSLSVVFCRTAGRSSVHWRQIPVSFFTIKFLNFIFLWQTVLSQHLHIHLLLQKSSGFFTFRPASGSEISKILFVCLNKQSDSDPIRTWLLKECNFFSVLSQSIYQLALIISTTLLKKLSFIPFLRNLPWTRMNFLIITQSPKFLIIENNRTPVVSLSTLRQTTAVIFTSLLTPNTTPLNS